MLLIVCLGAVGAIVPRASGSGRPRPIAHIACPQVSPGVCQDTGTIDFPPDSYGSQSDPVPGNLSCAADLLAPPFARPARCSTSADEVVASVLPQGASDVSALDDMWGTVIQAFPTLGGVRSKFVRRVITCAAFAASLATATRPENQYYTPTPDEEQLAFNNTYQLVLGLCIKLIVAEPPPPPIGAARDAAAGGGCSLTVGVPIEIARTRSGFVAKITGRAFKARAPSSPSVACRRVGNGIQLSVRARGRNKSLRRLLGPTLAIGFFNRTQRALHLATKYRWSRK